MILLAMGIRRWNQEPMTDPWDERYMYLLIYHNNMEVNMPYAIHGWYGYKEVY